MKFTLHELLMEYSVLIPQIQRDYAQGRADRLELRNNFLLKIKEALVVGASPLNLDFVYGYTQERGDMQSVFVPLDGQQRLTTLWLLHWFLAPRIALEENGRKLTWLTKETRKWLGRFSYETRNSSQRFCSELIKNGLPETSTNISASIANSPWFMTKWNRDPTVISMFNTLDSIQAMDFNKIISWDNLIENRKITFDYIDIRSNEFRLTDELYIKMNSRGKPLTAFENFKAQFSEVLSSNETDYIDERLSYNNIDITYQEYFSFKIDGEWMDLMWNFSNRFSDCEIKLDVYLMNYFYFIAQMCYFKINFDKNAEDFNGDFSVFKKKDEILFLFNSLDWFYEISIKNGVVNSDLIDQFFQKIFLNQSDKENAGGRIRLFDGIENNLFQNCLIDGVGFDHRGKIMLYCLLSFVIKFKITDVNNELKEYIRVVRNVLQATRQRKEIVFNSNVRINSFGKYWKLFHQLMSEKNTYECFEKHIDNKETDISDTALFNEKKKAEIILQGNIDLNSGILSIEELQLTGGLIHQFRPTENKQKLAEYAGVIDEIWSNDDSLIVGGLIASGFKGFYTKNCKLGEMRFFGRKSRWNTILTSEDEDISESIIRFLDNYVSKNGNSSIGKIRSIIDDYLNDIKFKGWQYYFLKYPKMLTKSNYFAWKGDFRIRILGSDGSNPLLAYHIDPYVFVISNLLADDICEEKDCYSQYGNESGLI